ncbi:hypothetical protein [uncultured Kiloniella sp.]|uniref:hypothetical protein n=1 Tax=uncultured Kiloniella sp. TaxID=1133091 RepID=UPI002631F0FE|nr:hypothetical protein [uncultured Kiloniella sp.]
MGNTETTSGALQVTDNALQVIPQGDIFNNITAFEEAQRIIKPLIDSDMVPDIYQGKVGNGLIALDMARRLNASPLMLMQNLNIIHGRPSLASQMVIACLNSCKKFSPLRYRIKDLGNKKVEYTEVYWENKQKKYRKISTEIKDTSFIAYATDLSSGEEIEGPEVTVEMAVQEGWYGKAGSKWKTMPGLMGRYRSAAFFGRLYAPEITMGMPTDDEVIDLGPQDYSVSPAPDLVDPSDDAIEEVEAEIVEETQSEKTKPSRKPRATKAELDQAFQDGISAFNAGKFDNDYSENCTSEALKKRFIEGHHSAQKANPENEEQDKSTEAPFEAPDSEDAPDLNDPSDDSEDDWSFGD